MVQCNLISNTIMMKFVCLNDEVPKYDIVVVGAGIIGLGTALELSKRLPRYNICVVDKENYVAAHQSSHNSGVIHAGIYYKPGSLRAELCVKGMLKMYKYCDDNDIPYKRNGKLIIAVSHKEVEWLKNLFVRGNENKVPGLELLSPDGFREIEPYSTGLKAIYSPYTGIVDFARVARNYGSNFKQNGGKIILNFDVKRITKSTEGDSGTNGDTSAYPIMLIDKKDRAIRAGFVLTCCGLQSDAVAQLTGEPPEPVIVPFRGQYFVLTKEKEHMCRGNIYPVPDPSMPFIGVHFTPKMDGSIWVGPTAMIAYKKEGYKWNEIDLHDILTLIKFPGVYRFFLKHPKMCCYEILRSASKRILYKELQMYMPKLRLKDIIYKPIAGVQAQAMNRDGTFSADFNFSGKGRVLHCRNCPSPAATSSLAVSEYAADKVMKLL
ncbi:L-2-hydroxyglutarate dehydrogenase, mitochondrial-like isoform X2 [Lycorma delicatula]|uniref:L-2-hydroxyglutarate dehydrogenase, mitochondrial-like isoform X2 n=1 Tax=Lycorma delicatula TaxID=130591 RepID=UPI003F50EE0C